MHISKTPIFCVILSSLLNAANGAPIEHDPPSVGSSVVNNSALSIVPKVSKDFITVTTDADVTWCRPWPNTAVHHQNSAHFYRGTLLNLTCYSNTDIPESEDDGPGLSDPTDIWVRTGDHGCYINENDLRSATINFEESLSLCSRNGPIPLAGNRPDEKAPVIPAAPPQPNAPPQPASPAQPVVSQVASPKPAPPPANNIPPVNNAPPTFEINVPPAPPKPSPVAPLPKNVPSPAPKPSAGAPIPKPVVSAVPTPEVASDQNLEPAFPNPSLISPLPYKNSPSPVPSPTPVAPQPQPAISAAPTPDVASDQNLAPAFPNPSLIAQPSPKSKSLPPAAPSSGILPHVDTPKLSSKRAAEALPKL